MVAEITFEDARVKWAPLLTSMSRRFVPYLDQEDLRQELELVLFKCCRGFNGQVMFYTYLRRALENQVKKLITRQQRHNPRYSELVYLSELDVVFDDRRDGPLKRLWRRALEVHEDEEQAPELFLTTCGFEGLELSWMLGRAQGLFSREIALNVGVSEMEIKKAARSAKRRARTLGEVMACQQ